MCPIKDVGLSFPAGLINLGQIMLLSNLIYAVSWMKLRQKVADSASMATVQLVCAAGSSCVTSVQTHHPRTCPVSDVDQPRVEPAIP